MANSVPIHRYIDVRKHPTVVRLDHLEEGADWIRSSFYITQDIRDQLKALQHTLQQATGTGIFLIGQYGSGKSHWLAYVSCQIRQGLLVPDAPEVVPLSLVNYRATTPLEDIVSEALGISPDSRDRRESWSRLASLQSRGIVLLLDELSEFLGSKPDRRAFNEDVRFLQYMGEWAQAERFWIVAAMQEGIEHTGELEHGLYRKIKDRYPLRFLLSPGHVKDLIQESILVKSEGCQEAVDALASELQRALPDSSINYDDFRGLYPLHPATLELLEEVRDRFSQARGVVDFTVTQLGGDSSRNIEPFLDQPWGSLLTPDYIVDHFRDLFELQPEFIGLAQQYFAYYRKHLPELFPSSAARQLATRLLKLLALTYLSPGRDGLEVREAATWLLFRATRIDPQKNLEIVERTLRQLAERGRYIVEREGHFSLQLRDDGTAAFEGFLEREKEQLKEQGETVFEQLAAELSGTDLFPVDMPGEQWQPRSVSWHFHDRPYQLYVGNEAPPPVEGAALCIRFPWGSTAPAAGAYTLQPRPLNLGEELLELAALLRGRKRAWNQDVTRRLEARIAERQALFRSQLHAAYGDLQVTGPSGELETPPRFDSSQPWLEQCAQWMMRRRFPAFERFAPVHGPLPKEAYRSLMRYAADSELGDYDADEYVKLIREAYLVPMRLLVRKGRSYAVASNLERHELVAMLRPLLDLQPSPDLIYDNASVSIYGLVPDQISVLLVFLHIFGEIDLVKGRRSYRELYETLPDPRQYDKVATCEALSLEQLRDLQVLCKGFQLPVPAQWTVLAQRRMAGQLRKAIGQRTQPLRSLLSKLHEQEGAVELASTVHRVISWEKAFHGGGDELDDFQQFLFEIGSPRRFLDTMAELTDLPERLDRLLSERRRYEHLFQHQALAGWADSTLAMRLEQLQTPPKLGQLEAVEQWLKESREVYEQYKTAYRKQHDQWWQEVLAEPIWQWQPPAVASSRHVDLDDTLEQLRVDRQRAERLRCSGLINLDFQPRCACDFDGKTSPVEQALSRLHTIRDRVHQTLTLFFRQQEVRERIRQWVEQGFETNPATLAYLKGKEPFPEITNVELLDRHLAGVELVKQLDTGTVVELLCQRTWEKADLRDALTDWLNRLPDSRLRFQPPMMPETSELAEWSLQQALQHAIPLPQALRSVSSELVERIRPEWVSGETLAKVDQLGLGQRVIDRIVQWVLEDQIRLPAEIGDCHSNSNGAFLAAASELLRPSRPADARELATLTSQLYSVHDRMLPVAGSRWLDQLDAVSSTPLPPAPRLVEALTQYERAQHLLIDGLGLPLLDATLEQIDELFPGWRLVEVSFARVEGPSTTDACYRQLVESGFQHKLEKINRVDALIHQRFLPFDEFTRLAMAELGIACRRTRSRLAERKPLVVFADHGFRLAPDGRSYCHGGNSTLECTVPILHLVPR